MGRRISAVRWCIVNSRSSFLIRIIAAISSMMSMGNRPWLQSRAHYVLLPLILDGFIAGLQLERDLGHRPAGPDKIDHSPRELGKAFSRISLVETASVGQLDSVNHEAHQVVH